jgi:hypothetical protein
MFINKSYLLLLFQLSQAKMAATTRPVAFFAAMLEKIAVMLVFLSPCYQKWPPC